MLYSTQDFQELRSVGALASECLKMLNDIIVPGITTQDIDDYVKQYAKTKNLVCAPFGYKGFPAHCCTSVNHVCCHGIPSSKILNDGDIISVDVTFINASGYYGDTCSTYVVGSSTSKKADIVMSTAKEALAQGLEFALPGNNIGHIGNAIRRYIEKTQCSVVREYVGHGIGKQFHEKPDVPHYVPETLIDYTTHILPGMVFTIEPIINFGSNDVKVLKDNWTVVTRDRSLSAQYEHTIGINETGFEIFTA